MSERVLIVNPRRKKKRKSRRKKRRSPKMRTKIVTKYRYWNPKKKFRRRRYRRNPGLKFMGLDLMPIVGGTGIAIGSKILPGFVSRFVPFNIQTGPMGYLARIGSGMFLAWAADKFLKQRAIAKAGVQFTFATVLTDLANDLLFAQGGLQGLGSGLAGNLGQVYPGPMVTEGLRGNLGDIYDPAPIAVANGNNPYKNRWASV